MPQPAGANAESALPIAEPCEYASAEREACEILDQAWGGVGNHTEFAPSRAVDLSRASGGLRANRKLGRAVKMTENAYATD